MRCKEEGFPFAIGCPLDKSVVCWRFLASFFGREFAIFFWRGQAAGIP